MNIQPIRTSYKGVTFRSKLEAQYARTFDALYIKWIYEPTGYALSNGLNYLPDFYLPDADQFFEVKGVLDDVDLNKMGTLQMDSRKSVIMGNSQGELCSICTCDIWDESEGHFNTRFDTLPTYLCVCGVCGKLFFAEVIERTPYPSCACGCRRADFLESHINLTFQNIFEENAIDYRDHYLNPNRYIYFDSRYDLLKESMVNEYILEFGFKDVNSLDYGHIKNNTKNLFGCECLAGAIHDRINECQIEDIKAQISEGKTLYQLNNDTPYSNNKIKKVFNSMKEKNNEKN